MSDLERMIDDGEEDTFLREVLASAKDDVPDAGRRALALAALAPDGIAEPAKTGAAATAPVATPANTIVTSGGATLKWVVIVGLAVGALAIGLYPRSGGEVAPSGAVSAPVPVVLAPPPLPAASTIPREGALPADIPAASASSPETAVASSHAPTVDTGVKGGTMPGAEHGPKPVARAPLGLAEETAILDRARSAIARGDARAALTELDRYDAAPSPKILGQEATLVRIEALSAKGDSAGARALALSFLARNPGSAYDDRVRALIAEPRKP